MTAPDLSPEEKAEVARFGIHDEGPGLPDVRVVREAPYLDARAEEPFRIEDTCCGRCHADTCYVDQITGA